MFTITHTQATHLLACVAVALYCLALATIAPTVCLSAVAALIDTLPLITCTVN